LDAKKHNVSSQPFRPAPVCPEPSGKGSVYGTFKHEFPLSDESKPIKLRELPKEKTTEPEKRNFTTRPGKKGSGYGYANITIGTDYEYISDPFDTAIQLAKKERVQLKEKLISKKPFIPGFNKNELFSPFTGLAPEENIEEKSKEIKTNTDKKEEDKVIPFKPTNYNNGPINKYPNYEVPKKTNQKELTPQEKIELLKKPGLIFRPGGKTRPFPIKSIISANVPICAPAWIRANMKSHSSI
jgi:hypothetical protein